MPLFYTRSFTPLIYVPFPEFKTVVLYRHDNHTLAYFHDNQVFADTRNGSLFQSKPIIHPKLLKAFENLENAQKFIADHKEEYYNIRKET